jgi:hypothetical protein
MWDKLCNKVVSRLEIEYKQMCHEKGIHDSSDLICMIVSSIRNLPAYVAFTNNIFLHEETKQWIHKVYPRCMHIYLCIKRCILRYVYKHRKSCNMVDLSYTPFTEYVPSLCIHLIDNGKKYTFTHPELYNIIENSLANSDTYMISNPLPIKNPYTGIPFSKEMLYFLFLNLRHIPLLFRHFVRDQFDIQLFLLENESILRQHQIHKRVRDIPKASLHQEMQDMIIEMCFYLSYTLNIENHIIKITQNEKDCRTMLTHYYNYMYSLNPYQRQCECQTLIKKLKIMCVKPI